MRRRALVWLAAGQGIYYVGTGIWSLVDLASFQAVTGPKTDLWLVRTVGVLVLASGAVMLLSASRLRVPIETALLAIGSALGLAAIDVVHATRDVISDVYLVDAAVEVALAILWGVALWRSRDELALWGRDPGGGAWRRGVP